MILFKATHFYFCHLFMLIRIWIKYSFGNALQKMNFFIILIINYIKIFSFKSSRYSIHFIWNITHKIKKNLHQLTRNNKVLRNYKWWSNKLLKMINHWKTLKLRQVNFCIIIILIDYVIKWLTRRQTIKLMSILSNNKYKSLEPNNHKKVIIKNTNR